MNVSAQHLSIYSRNPVWFQSFPKQERNKSLTPTSSNGHRVLHESGIRAERTNRQRIARDKITRVFRYLEALNQHRNPVQRQLDGQLWSQWLHDLPCHDSVRQGAVRSNSLRLAGQDAASRGSDKNSGEDFVFKVQRPKLSLPPHPPKEIAAWLKDGWDDPAREASFHETRSEQEQGGQTEFAKFSDDATTLAAFQRWQLQREQWARNEIPARASMKIFETLYELHGRLEREAERVELILGNGILSWSRPDGNIYHPVLFQRLQLEFNPAIPEFTLSEADYPVELYSALFQSLSHVDGRALGRCREELERGGYHPLGDEATSSFLKRLVMHLSPRGEFVKGEVPKREGNEPRIGRDPVVFLRHRTTEPRMKKQSTPSMLFARLKQKCF